VTPVPRPLLASLLVAIIATWGICPCTMGKIFGIGDGPVAPCCAHPSGDAGHADLDREDEAPCCCCKHHAEPPSEDGAKDVPADDECPCCSHGGCLRDLPPSAPVLALELPAPTFLDLPILVAALRCELPAPEVVAFDAGPPSAHRPHAAPIGVVRLIS
jgi:hypothetical protein